MRSSHTNMTKMEPLNVGPQSPPPALCRCGPRDSHCGDGSRTDDRRISSPTAYKLARNPLRVLPHKLDLLDDEKRILTTANRPYKTASQHCFELVADDKIATISHRQSTIRTIPLTFYNEDDDEDDEDKEDKIDLPRFSMSSRDSRIDSSPLDRSSEIRHVYLTFDSALPAPVCDLTTLPEHPDLSLYVNPTCWPRARKNMMVAVSCIATAITAYTAGAYSAPADLIAAEFGTTHELALLGVTTFCLGFALAPMILAPFSEVNGRYPVFAIAGVLFTVSQAVCGVVTNLTGMLIARFFKGVGGSVFSTMVGGVISDLYEKENRNTPMALFSGAVLIGTGLGPLVSSIIVQKLGSEGQQWKWVFWHQVIIDGLLSLAVIGLFRESRGSVVLSRKARAMNQWYEELEQRGVFGVWLHGEGPSTDGAVSGIEKSDEKAASHLNTSGNGGFRVQRIRWVVKSDEERGTIYEMITTSLVRPFHLLFTEPIVFFFSLWVSFAWAVLYLTFGSVPLVFKQQYNFTTEQAGYVFIAMIAGSILATVIGIYQEDLLSHPSWRAKSTGSGSDEEVETEAEHRVETTGVWGFLQRRFPAESPESRLYFTCFTAVLLPVGLFLFGFSARPSVHWIVPAIGIGLASAGIYYIYLATFNYLADIYHAYASSALAAQSFCRNILGGAFPLVTGYLFTNLGDGPAGGLLGGIAVALTLVPWALVLFGERIRSRSKFAVALETHT
ncbi:MFS general substrate transporter [Xylariaceae sp. FL1272]|nr:MFS general substrate transporter [Xylariaceae sp. FL1272]